MLSLSQSSQSSQLTDYINGLEFEKLQAFIPTIASSYAQINKMYALMYAYPTEDARAQKLMEDINGVEATETTEAVAGYTDEQCADYFDSVMPFSSTTYDENLVTLGCLDLGSPSSVSLYAISFSAKEDVENEITKYNDSLGEEESSKKIQYTDYVGIIMKSVTTIINAVTYVLIAFVSISLIVSSIMIGVITLISVQERTKEIGILRAIGASKRNVSSMFNAETIIIGFTSGLLGVLITYVLCLIVNVILHSLTGIMSLNAVLPIGAAVVLICISMLLTLIAGIIPSRSAAKKDPVVALRSE
jgi:putative ABC transport system permease protein